SGRSRDVSITSINRQLSAAALPSHSPFGLRSTAGIDSMGIKFRDSNRTRIGTTRTGPPGSIKQ
ncbi:hypothetical protein KIN20_033219, partial [Parelaphostrongylus tenuis]